MDSKASDGLFSKRVVVGFSYWGCFFLLVLITVYGPPAHAGKWFVTPSLTIRETFSDNINLAPSGAERSAFVTEINPGIIVQRLGGKTQVNLLYQMQNVINRGGTGGLNVNHQLQAGASTIIEPNRLFVNANSSISQQNVVNTGPVTTGNLTNSANRANVYTFGVNPTWTPHFNGYADGIVQLGYDFLGTSSTAVSDSHTFRGNVGLTSGYRFNKVTWRMGYTDTYSLRSDDVGNVRFRNYIGQVRYNFSRRYSVFALGGYTDNSIPGTVTSNGEFYTFGAAWTPSQRFGLEGGYGQNLYFATLNWLPTLRTNVNVGYRNSDVGTNTGDVWNARITHRTARVFWSANYSENTTTVQNILESQSLFNTAGASGQSILSPAGQPVSSPVVTQPFSSNVGLPTFSNSVLIQRIGSISISGGTAKSSLGLTLFNSRREDLTNPGTDDNSLGVSGFWNWRFVPRTSSNLFLSWNRNTNDTATGALTKANFYLISLGLTRNIADYFNVTKGIFGSVNYRYSKQDSTDSTFSYTENSVAATLSVNF